MVHAASKSMLCLAIVALAASCGNTSDGRRSADFSVALVNGVPITQQTYDEQELLFTNPDGLLEESGSDILLSLINQALTHQAAQDLGITIDPATLDERARDAAGLEMFEDGLERAGGFEALKRRLRNFLELTAVKEVVVRDVTIPDQDVLEAYEHDPALASVPFADAEPVVRQRLERIEQDASWTEWLTAKRACASIVVQDVSLGVPSSTPAPACPLTTGLVN
jgi:hypothetical protein